MRRPKVDADAMRRRLLRLFEYDETDGVFFWRGGIGGRSPGDLAGYLNSGEFWVIQIDRATYGAHRLVWLMHHGEWPPLLFHIDGDRRNNRIDNLRPANGRGG